MGEIDIQDLKKRVDHLQYDEIEGVKKEIGEIKITLNTNDLLTRQAIESNQKMSDALEVLKSTMIEVAQSVKDSAKITGELTITVEELNKKINSVEISTNNAIKEFGKKVNEVDEKSKIDLLKWMRDNWFPMFITIGGLVYVISQIVK